MLITAKIQGDGCLVEKNNEFFESSDILNLKFILFLLTITQYQLDNTRN